MTDKERIMEKKVKFEVGKWYKILWKWNNSYYYAKFKGFYDNSYNWIEWVKLPNGKLDRDNSFVEEELGIYSEATLEEIQQYLPDDHPDKIKSDIKFKVGDWVVNLENSISYNVNEICRVSKISKTYLACENKPQDGGYMKSFDKFRHATPEEIYNYSNVWDKF